MSLIHGSLIQSKPPLFHVKADTTHFCLYPAESYDVLISVAMAKPFPIDFNFKKSSEIKEICTHPFLALQAPGKSDILSKPMDYTSLLLYAERFLDRVLKKGEAEEEAKAKADAEAKADA